MGNRWRRTGPIEALEVRTLLSFTPVGGETVVTGGVLDPVVDVAVADDGRSHIVVTELRLGSVRHITAFRYDASGQLLGRPITLYRYVQPGPAQLWSNVSVAMDADGDAVVAYAVDDGTDGGLFFNRISRTGAVAPTVKVAAGQDMSMRGPSVVMNNGGQFYLGWIAEGDTWNDRAMVRAYGVDGTPRADAYVAARTDELTPFGTFGSIDVAVEPFSSVAAFAVSLQITSANDPNRQSIHYGVLGVTGPAGPRREVDGVGDKLNPALALNPAGNFALTYIGQASAGDATPTLRVQSFSAYVPQNPPGPSFPLQTPVAGAEIRSPRLALLPSGNFAAVFTHAGDEVDTIYATEYANRSASLGLAEVDTDPRFDSDQFIDGKFLPAFDVDAFGNGVAAYVERSTNSVVTRRVGSMIAELRGAELFVNGTEGDDHIIVERVRTNVFVNINGFVKRFSAADVAFLSIAGMGGDNDIINATALPATIHGGDGRDTIWGGTGSDRIRGFGGNDVLRGGDGNDIVFGDDGDDTLHGGNGRDTLRGGGGVNVSIAGEVTDPVPANVSIDANGVVIVEGTDQPDAVAAWGDSLIVVVETAGSTRSFPRDNVTLIDVRGHGGGDTLVMNLLLPVPTRIDGGAGGDVIRGGARGDVLRGGDGNDSIYGGRGEDTLAGDAGNDWAYGESGSDRMDPGSFGGIDHMDGGSEVDTLDYSLRTDPLDIQLQWGDDGESGERDHAQNVEILIGGAGDDFIQPIGDVDTRPAQGFTVFGGAGDDTIRTGGANDVLFGEDGDDDIDGRGGSDHVEGGAGNDTIRSTDGALQFNGFDSLFGSAGNDTFLTDDGVADRIRGGPGDDAADADSADDVLDVESVS